MKKLTLTFATIILMTFTSFGQEINVKKLLDKAETRSEIFNTIAGNHELMKEFMKVMKGNEHAMMMMNGDQKMMKHEGEMKMTGDMKMMNCDDKMEMKGEHQGMDHSKMMGMMKENPEMMQKMMGNMMKMCEQDSTMRTKMSEMMAQHPEMMKEMMKRMKDQGMMKMEKMPMKSKDSELKEHKHQH